jgi:hypothetical protein
VARIAKLAAVVKFGSHSSTSAPPGESDQPKGITTDSALEHVFGRTLSDVEDPSMHEWS